MSEENTDSVPKKTVAELQLDVAKIAFELAKVSSVLKYHFAPRNALMAPPDPANVYKQMQESYDKMMDLCGELIGADE